MSTAREIAEAWALQRGRHRRFLEWLNGKLGHSEREDRAFDIARNSPSVEWALHCADYTKADARALLRAIATGVDPALWWRASSNRWSCAVVVHTVLASEGWAAVSREWNAEE